MFSYSKASFFSIHPFEKERSSTKRKNSAFELLNCFFGVSDWGKFDESWSIELSFLLEESNMKDGSILFEENWDILVLHSEGEVANEEHDVDGLFL